MTKKNRTSYGIAIFTITDDNEIYLLLSQKRLTYEFINFATGNYNPNCNNDVIELLCKMTIEEKNIIMHGFNRIWQYYTMKWDNNFYRNTSNNNLYNKGNNAFSQIKNIRSLVSNSTNGERIWEMPKGRIERDECELDAAIREVDEEIGFTINKSDIINYIPPVNFNITDYEKNYEMVYYLALVDNTYIDKNFKYSQVSKHEISDVKWVNIRCVGFLQKSKFVDMIIKVIDTFTKSCIENNSII